MAEEQVGLPESLVSEENHIPANLARLRLDRGLTQAQLAEKAGISRVAVGKIERGAVLPKTTTTALLARALRTSYGDLVLPVRPLRSVRFRARARVHGREQILAEVSQWLDGYLMLEEALGDRRPFRFEAAQRRRRASDPAAAARAARKAVGLRPDAPVEDICRLMEESGVKVLPLKKQRDSFFGLSVGPVDGGPAVVANTWDRISVERWIFTVAHELGHLLLHPHEYEATIKDHPVSAEREADAFAAEFLMPEAAFARSWDDTYGFPLVVRVLRVKRLFRVSYRAVLYRLVDTGRETPGLWAAFQKQYRDRYGRTLGKADEPNALTESAFAWRWRRAEEPVALTEFDFLETRLHRLVRRALVKGEISMSRGAEIVGLHLEDMREWVRGWRRS